MLYSRISKVASTANTRLVKTSFLLNIYGLERIFKPQDNQFENGKKRIKLEGLQKLL